MNQRTTRLVRQLNSLIEASGVAADHPEIAAVAAELVAEMIPEKVSSRLQSQGKLKGRSLKREEQYGEYRQKRQDFLNRNRYCQVEGCKNRSQDVHHIKKRNGKRLLDEQFWLACCRACHTKITDNPQWAIENGYLLKVNGNG